MTGKKEASGGLFVLSVAHSFQRLRQGHSPVENHLRRGPVFETLGGPLVQMRARKLVVLESVHAAREAQRSKIASGRLPRDARAKF
jgi:hypothetical protein